MLPPATAIGVYERWGDVSWQIILFSYNRLHYVHLIFLSSVKFIRETMGVSSIIIKSNVWCNDNSYTRQSILKGCSLVAVVPLIFCIAYEQFP